MAKVNINDVLQGLIQPIGSLKGGSTYPVTAADQIWVYTDHDTHRPLDEYLGAMKTEAAETTQTFVSNATALTDGKIAKTSIVGGRAAKCKVGDIVMVADGNIYKISAIDETNITLALPALASYAPAAAIKNRVLHGDLKDATGAPSYPSGGGGGGKQVAPMLNLMDLSDDDFKVRTSITEEEAENIEKGLYNSVFYMDLSLGEEAAYSVYLPECATCLDGMYIFSIYTTSFDVVHKSLSITGSRIYTITPGEEINPDGTYPITIEKVADASFGSGGSGGGQQIIIDDDFPATTQGTFTGELTKNTDSVYLSKTHSVAKIINTIFEGIGGYAAFMTNNGGVLELNIIDISRDPVGYQIKTYALPSEKMLRHYSHFITLSSSTLGNIYFNYYNNNIESPSSIDDLKTVLAYKSVACSGYINDGGTKKIATYIRGESGGLTVWWFDASDGTQGRTIIDNTFSFNSDTDDVEENG